MRIAVLGGTFNPIHNGHMAIAQAIIRQNLASQVWLMVTPCNPWKQDRLPVPNDVRLEMVQAAVAGLDGIKAQDYEFHLPYPQYTSSTLKALHEEYPEHSFTLVIGADNWVRFNEWHQWQYIAANFRIVVYPRTGANINTCPDELKHVEVTMLECPLCDISSTRIRSMVNAGQPIDSLVSPGVAAIIKAKSLYRGNL